MVSSDWTLMERCGGSGVPTGPDRPQIDLHCLKYGVRTLFVQAGSGTLDLEEATRKTST